MNDPAAPRATADAHASRAGAAVPRGLVGVVHMRGVPGDPAFAGSMEHVREHALADARALAAGGASAIIVENYGSAPFAKGVGDLRIPPAQIAALAVVADRIRQACEVPVGINCLRNDVRSALAVAAVVGATFVRVNVHVGAYVTDQGVIEGEAEKTLRERRALGVDHVAILADVLVKHAAPLVPVSPEQATHDTVLRGLADAVIVTGEATGAPVSEAMLERVARAAGAAPVLIGSGLTIDNAARLAPLVHGAIVGTWLKYGGDVHDAVDVDRVRALRAACHFRA